MIFSRHVVTHLVPALLLPSPKVQPRSKLTHTKAFQEEVTFHQISLTCLVASEHFGVIWALDF